MSDDDKKLASTSKVVPKKTGFDRGLEPSHITQAGMLDDKLMFYVAWKDNPNDEVDLLPADVIYKKCPQLAIKYFEDILEWE